MSFNLAVILTETARSSPEQSPRPPRSAWPDERLGEEVMAVIITRPSMLLVERELIAYCRERMAAYKCPRVFQFRSELPKNAIGKVLKDELVRGYGALS
jgi:acyl-CoA synthetase (AMP-forming)/AMP-acid ligase II